MTALIGVVVDGVGYLAADRQQSLSNFVTHNVKIVEHPDDRRIQFCASGDPLIAYPATLVDPPTDENGEMHPPGPGWVDRYWRRMLELGHPPLDRDGDLDGNLLVLTPGAVTMIGNSGWPTAVSERGVALGSSGDFALGAYHAHRAARPDASVLDAVTAAIQVACYLSHYASGGVDVAVMGPVDNTREEIPAP